MFEKVNPSHPDKIADRIAGAIVDLAYKKVKDPRIAVEVLIGHGRCLVMVEASVSLYHGEIEPIVHRIAGDEIRVYFYCYKQNKHLADNQAEGFRCGDNGIFRGCPVTPEQKALVNLAQDIYEDHPSDGKYLMHDKKLVICQSLIAHWELDELSKLYPGAVINPLGFWSGGLDVDTGATNRKLGSDMGDAVTGGGLHGKDLSKADVSVNIYAHLKAQKTGAPVSYSCAIGDDTVDGKPYSEIVEIARDYVRQLGGFEKFAEWGLLR